MVEEAASTPVQQAAYVRASSRDTVRSRSFTGQVVGQFEKLDKTVAVIERWVTELIDATEYLNALKCRRRSVS